MSSLYYLDLIGNQISDLGPVAGLTNLGDLNMGGNLLTNLSALSNLTQLNYLDIRGNHIFRLDPLSGLTNLTQLYASYNRISNLGALTNIPHLNYAGLSYNNLDLSYGSAASNTVDSLTQKGVLVEVVPQRTVAIITTQPVSQLYSAGSNVDFTIVYTPYSPGPVSLQWYFNDTPLTDGGKISGSMTNDLIITNLGLGNLGRYYCVVDDGNGPVYSDEATLSTNVVHPDWIVDSNLLVAIANQLGIPSEEVNKSNLANLYTLYSTSSYSISNLSGLQYATNLNYLGLSFNNITDFSPIGSLTNLATLYLES